MTSGELRTQLDRTRFAIDLRRAGLVNVSSEAWNGLSDEEVVGLVQFMEWVTIDPEFIKEHTDEV